MVVMWCFGYDLVKWVAIVISGMLVGLYIENFKDFYVLKLFSNHVRLYIYAFRNINSFFMIDQKKALGKSGYLVKGKI